ncbi:MAG TPA: DUF4184 family protein [Flavilitoribacter sp.]|nr:DUF4184 family protein [Flavilitoribacter sp.]HMQ87995.1 DUF4184 family protein [Flavilitoribacter sp.]
MPFTFSHPAVILPLTYLPRRWFSLTGLVIGSLTPDFEYFLRMRLQSRYSHTTAGLFWFDLPLGLVLAFLFHNQVRNSLFDNLPPFFKSRFQAFRQFNWNSYFIKHIWIVAVSILVGAASHLLWDSFTHKTGYFVRTLPALAGSVELSGIQLPIFKLLQHISTIIGGVVIAFVIYKLPVDNRVTGSINLTYWAVVFMLAMAAFLIRYFNGPDLKASGNLIAAGISAVLMGLILTPWIVKPNRRSHMPQPIDF